jgi:ureidoglycolate lyase
VACFGIRNGALARGGRERHDGGYIMARTVDIAVEPMTASAFEPFGTIVGASAGPPALDWGTLQTWMAPFDVDGTTQMTLCRYHQEPVEWSRMERHLAVTQAFLPLAGVASVMVVAPPSDPSDRTALPPPESVRAFRMDGSAGVVLHRGTWHAIRRFPIGAPLIDIVLLTGRDTQAELERQARYGSLPMLTHEADYASVHGVTFRAVGLSVAKR